MIIVIVLGCLLAVSESAVRRLRVRIEALEAREDLRTREQERLAARLAALETGAAPADADGVGAGTLPAGAAVAARQAPGAPAETAATAAASGAAAPVPRAPPADAAAGRQARRETPSPGEPLVTTLRAGIRWLAGGNALVRVGAVILLVGTVFLLRLVADMGLLPPAVRLGFVTLAGTAVAAVGWYLRGRAGNYGLVLQGVGIAVIHLCIAAALHLYDLVGPGAALASMLVVVGLATALAVLQNSVWLALYATTTGLLAPIVTSDGGGSLFGLLCFYLVVDAGVLVIARFRAWRSLNWVAFAFTWPMAGLWALDGFQDASRAASQGLLAALFALFMLVPILFARSAQRLTGVAGVLDGALLFGTPALAFLVQAALVEDLRFGVATSALGLAAIYTLLARWCLRHPVAGADLLVRSFAALAVVFATLTLPFAFEDGRITGASWALEGAGLVWLGARQGRRLPRLAGLLLQPLALLAWVLGGGDRVPSDALPFMNGAILSLMLLGIGAVACARFLAAADARPRPLEWVAIGWGLVLWFRAGVHEVARVWPDGALAPLLALFTALTALGLLLAAGRARVLSLAVLAAAPVVLALVGLAVVRDPEGAEAVRTLASLAWLAAVPLLLVVLLRSRSAPLAVAAAQSAALVAAAALVTLVVAGVSSRLSSGAGVWALLAWLLVPLALRGLLTAPPAAASLAWLSSRGLAATVVAHWLPLALATIALAATLVGVLSPGAAAPLPFVPIINPLELAQLLVLATLLRAPPRLATNSTNAADTRAVQGALAVVALILLTAMVLRWVHQLAGVRWSLDALLASDLVQMGLSLAWTAAASAAMVVGTRAGRRTPWIAGAVLLALVVLKLFTVDLADTGALPRVVSFLGVGALVLVIGYFNPLPPLAPSRPEEARA
ncbi:MAG TPA: DUF2339 domain-containing protein [Pseudomonadales bacterium]|nr:DUF2339 domain-containing protein [Pseudomonadales bacterium]